MQVTERVPTLWGCIAGVDCTKRWAPRKELRRGIVQDCIFPKWLVIKLSKDGDVLANFTSEHYYFCCSRRFDPESSKFKFLRLVVVWILTLLKHNASPSERCIKWTNLESPTRPNNSHIWRFTNCSDLTMLFKRGKSLKWQSKCVIVTQ